MISASTSKVCLIPLFNNFCWIFLFHLRLLLNQHLQILVFVQFYLQDSLFENFPTVIHLFFLQYMKSIHSWTLANDLIIDRYVESLSSMIVGFLFCFLYLLQRYRIKLVILLGSWICFNLIVSIGLLFFLLKRILISLLNS